MNNLEMTTVLTGTVSASSLLGYFSGAIDIMWKIVAIIAGIISISCFVANKYSQIKKKIKEAKEDGVITKEEVKDIAKTVIEDVKELSDLVKEETDKVNTPKK